MNDLIVFVRARLDDDAAAARRAGDSFRQIGETGVIVATEGDRAEECASANWAGIAEHIVRHDPARVLAEVDAKRGLLDDLLTDQHGDSMWGAKFSCGAALDDRGMRLDPNDVAARRHPCDCGRDERVSRRIRQLALPYASHPDYPAKWRL